MYKIEIWSYNCSPKTTDFLLKVKQTRTMLKQLKIATWDFSEVVPLTL